MDIFEIVESQTRLIQQLIKQYPSASRTDEQKEEIRQEIDKLKKPLYSIACELQPRLSALHVSATKRMRDLQETDNYMFEGASKSDYMPKGIKPGDSDMVDAWVRRELKPGFLTYMDASPQVYVDHIKRIVKGLGLQIKNGGLEE